MRILILSLIAVTLLSCQKKEYESFRILPDMNKVVAVSLSPDSPVLIADGKAELSFKVLLYMEVSNTRFVEEKDGDVVKVVEKTFIDTIIVSQDRIDRSKVKIVKDDVKEVDYIYKTTEDIGKIVTFKAFYGDLVSKSREVRIIEKPQDNFTQIVIPVIFHVLHKKADSYQFDSITTAMLQRRIDRLNIAFSGKAHNTAAGFDSKITFELATHDYLGKLLPNKGINRVIVPDYETKISTYIDKNKVKLIWNLDNYLNIYINNEEYEDGPNFTGPKFMLNNNVGLSWHGWGDCKKPRMISDISLASYTKYHEVGIALHRSTLYQMELANNFYKIRLETLIGLFYGLVGNWSTDYDDNLCNDTYTYYDQRYNNPEKYVYQPGASTQTQRRHADVIYFKSTNIMDKVSECSMINYEQCKRIRTVMQYCPFRMMKKQ